MFEKLKDTISDLAFSAVSYAENKLQTLSGMEKKKIAIKYIVDKLPINPIFKGIISVIFGKIIDTAIESAVSYMHQVKYED